MMKNGITASQVAAAQWVLAHRRAEERVVRYSFAEWLVPYLLNDVLRLNVTGRFSCDGLNRVVALDDNVAIAWRTTKIVPSVGWGKALAEEADVSDETVYGRRRKWLAAYGVDVSIPYRYYIDLQSLGSLSVAESERRAALIAAVSRDDAKEVLPLLKTALEDFDRQRRHSVGGTVEAPLGEVDVVTIESPMIGLREFVGVERRFRRVKRN